MEERKEKEQVLQWHPAFYAGLQIELKEDSYNLIFENEHQLGTKPKSIDVLIIKKMQSIPVHKNIGRIFRKHNIVEYKSPTDYLAIDDFYKVYGYTCFYKAMGESANQIKLDELTITFVCHSYPRELIHHLKVVRNYKLQGIGPGIYYITGDPIPIQLLLTPRLPESENLWLKSLTNDLSETKTVEKLIQEYGNYKDNLLYKSMMDIIVRANKQKFQEVKNMCEALEELMKDELDAREQKGREDGIRIFILDNLSERKSEEQILEKLVKLFSLTLDEARGYYLKYSK